MLGCELARGLEAVDPLRLQAVELVLRLGGQPAAAFDPLQEQDAIEAALQELRTQGEKAQDFEQRCSRLLPIPTQTTVPGF